MGIVPHRIRLPCLEVPGGAGGNGNSPPHPWEGTAGERNLRWLLFVLLFDHEKDFGDAALLDGEVD